jgi:CheY-like chemotaxis protein
MPQPLRTPSTRTILIVDDDEAIREVLGGVLTDEGYAVVSAVNGAAALSLLEEMSEMPGLVLLDLMMPVMSGWEFLEVVRADERFAKVPIIVVSAMNAPGVSEHLAKPIDLDRLLSAVAKWCD